MECATFDSLFFGEQWNFLLAIKDDDVIYTHRLSIYLYIIQNFKNMKRAPPPPDRKMHLRLRESAGREPETLLLLLLRRPLTCPYRTKRGT